MKKLLVVLGISLLGALAAAAPSKTVWSCNIVSGEGDLENMDVYQTAAGELVGGMEYNRPFDDEGDWTVGPLEATPGAGQIAYGGDAGNNGYFYLTLFDVDFSNLKKGDKAKGTLHAFIPAKADPTGFGTDKIGGGTVECTYGVQDGF